MEPRTPAPTPPARAADRRETRPIAPSAERPPVVPGHGPTARRAERMTGSDVAGSATQRRAPGNPWAARNREG